MKGAGLVLKLLQTILYALEFCCAAVILGFYSYFLSILANRDLDIATWKKAVEGISGAAVLYTVFAVLFTCCLGAKMFFAFIAIVLDLAFCGAFIAIAVLTRSGIDSCEGNVSTPLGNGDANSSVLFGPEVGADDRTYSLSVSLGTACRMNRSVFIVAVIGAILFALSALVQLGLGRHHQREKRFGPSPANGYTSGSGRSFWRRRRGVKTTATRDAEMAGAAPLAAPIAPTHHHHTLRPSHDTAYTGSTVAAPPVATYDAHGKPVGNGYSF